MEFLVELAQVPIGSYATWGAVILVAVSGLIQIAPIKLNPWSSLARAIGRAINKDIIDRVSSVEKDIKEFRDQEDEREAKSHRMRILRFGDEIRHHQLHSAEHYNYAVLFPFCGQSGACGCRDASAPAFFQNRCRKTPPAPSAPAGHTESPPPSEIS